ncbi:branched-chain amino acid transporter permease [Campylobacter fetus]|uniref:Branched-chain amino acid ABC transporter n=2 Tax=Campylobacter fetus TaxID=196 RepID=A0AAX0H9P6_CAMFE|nr:AzlD domain-containing protein [Campylobacter fetus]ALV64954.1 branched-chain amino acid transport protein, AzlD family [Campylobacter fetus subsp. testudinum Sp3]AVK81200.1 branched-chain amino acid ABC transporter [Campylobacter fetus subsp. testudinum]EAK0829762.1 branched-chain amino acid ABC transporter [Campylobacter fetus]MPB71627.1 branched-chain amino acid ABC transporter [Campylobacter fetus]MPB77384.1 branched-chain amino acid ABC transporter [Campylobacter fetus]
MEYLPYILVAGFATVLTRFLPYWLFKKRSDNKTLLHLQRTTTLIIMIVLLFYALRSMDFSTLNLGFSAVFCLFLVFALQIWKKNSLISITVPTIIYMIIIRFV